MSLWFELLRLFFLMEKLVVIFYETYLVMAIGAKLSKESKGSGVRVGKPVQTVKRQAVQ